MSQTIENYPILRAKISIEEFLRAQIPFPILPAISPELWDVFITDADSPIVNRVCEPGPGVLAGTPSNNNIFIADRAIIFPEISTTDEIIQNALNPEYSVGYTYKIFPVEIDNTCLGLGLYGANFKLCSDGKLYTSEDSVVPLSKQSFDYLYVVSRGENEGLIFMLGKRIVYVTRASLVPLKIWFRKSSDEGTLELMDIKEFQAEGVYADKDGLTVFEYDPPIVSDLPFEHSQEGLIDFILESVPGSFGRVEIRFRWDAVEGRGYRLVLETDGTNYSQTLYEHYYTSFILAQNTLEFSVGDVFTIFQNGDDITIYQNDLAVLTTGDATRLHTQTNGTISGTGARPSLENFRAWKSSVVLVPDRKPIGG